jgi:hypothetical protein
METRKLRQISFGSFLKIWCASFFSFGFVLGAISFVVSTFNPEASTADLGYGQLNGLVAGIAGVFIFPLGTMLAGMFWGILAFLPFKGFLMIFGGMNLKLEVEEHENKLN